MLAQVSRSCSFFIPQAPADFRPAGHVTGAVLCDPPAIRRQKYTGKKALGVKYEKQVQAYLLDLYGDRYLESPWFRFWVEGRPRWCQPDGLLFDFSAGRITIIEVKYQHTLKAWYQIKKLYLPVLQTLFPSHLWRFNYCEIVRWYDPNTVFPEPVLLTHDIAQVSQSFQVHIWKP